MKHFSLYYFLLPLLLLSLHNSLLSLFPTSSERNEIHYLFDVKEIDHKLLFNTPFIIGLISLILLVLPLFKNYWCYILMIMISFCIILLYALHICFTIYAGIYLINDKWTKEVIERRIIM